jgi:hypothetical protein
MCIECAGKNFIENGSTLLSWGSLTKCRSSLFRILVPKVTAFLFISDEGEYYLRLSSRVYNLFIVLWMSRQTHQAETKRKSNSTVESTAFRIRWKWTRVENTYVPPTTVLLIESVLFSDFEDEDTYSHYFPRGSSKWLRDSHSDDIIRVFTQAICQHRRENSSYPHLTARGRITTRLIEKSQTISRYSGLQVPFLIDLQKSRTDLGGFHTKKSLLKAKSTVGDSLALWSKDIPPICQKKKLFQGQLSWYKQSNNRLSSEFLTSTLVLKSINQRDYIWYISSVRRKHCVLIFPSQHRSKCTIQVGQEPPRTRSSSGRALIKLLSADRFHCGNERRMYIRSETKVLL